jgi:hypothetical protein
MESTVLRRSLMRRLADVGRPGSFSNRMRARRFQGFDRLVEEATAGLDRPARILDVGGTNRFWEHRGWTDRDDVEIVTVNLAAEPRVHPNVQPCVGDATDLSDFPDGAFDVVFSNSVIEHLGNLDSQAAMAWEVRRLARRYWVQTPNYWFPVEPHFLTLCWHWLPRRVRVALLRRHRFGWRGPCPDPEGARATVDEIRLMKRRELKRLFPDAELRAERIGPFVKSFVAVRSGIA